MPFLLRMNSGADLPQSPGPPLSTRRPASRQDCPMLIGDLVAVRHPNSVYATEPLAIGAHTPTYPLIRGPDPMASMQSGPDATCVYIVPMS